jgi:phosphoribosylaminoimidazolecarboxamide formyltransferase/IMP cyclohydrolase
VLVSGAGTNLQALLDACSDPAYGAQVVAVGADRDGIEGLARAGRAGVPTFVHRLADHPSREAWDAALTASCQAHDPDLVVLAGFMKLTGPAFLDAFGGRCVNTHPALSPSFPGMHGPADALAHGVRVTGATLFVVDAGVDTGPIVAQTTVPVEDDDDVATLHERIKVAERAMLVATVGRMAREGFTISDRKVRIGTMTQSTESTTQAATGTGSDGSDERRPVRRALVSVYDKTGLEELAQALHAVGVVIVSTGSTAGRIAAAGVPVTEVETLTGFPECLDGRVKTLHPAVHAGILADLRLESHRAQLVELGIEAFDLVVSNLYPFVETVTSGATSDECVEQIDIGGPSMVRAAAKNHPSVAVVTSPAQYAELLAAVGEGGTTLAHRQRLAAEAFVHTATYDVAVASWMGNVLTDTSGGTGFPAWVGATWDRATVLRYGENPHQRAALYTSGFAPVGGLAQAHQLHGKEMSYNNYVDADAARRAAFDFDEPAVAIIKHANPCGIAIGADVADAHRRAHACDPVSAFGGVIATNVPVSVAMAEQVADVFTEVVVAPGFEDGAVEVLSRKKNVRLLECGPPARGGVEIRPITGGLLMQATDAVDAVVQGGGDDPSAWTLVSGEPATEKQLGDLAFAWTACRAVKSNAILLASDGASVGVGMGQVNRVDSCRLAVDRAGERAVGSVAASDAFFPFPDGPQILVDAGVTAIVQPGGSVRDPEVIEALQAAGVTMYLTGTRHFFH